MRRLPDDCLLLMGEYSSARTLSRLLVVLDRSELMPDAYQRIMPIMHSDLLPFHGRSLREGMDRMGGETRLRFFIEMQDRMAIFLHELDELDLHFSFKRRDYAEANVWRLLDGLRLIHHPDIYAKIFMLRHYGMNDVLSMLTDEEIRELLLDSALPVHLHHQLSSYEWTHRV